MNLRILFKNLIKTLLQIKLDIKINTQIIPRLSKTKLKNHNLFIYLLPCR